MKKLLSLTLLLVSFSAFAQLPINIGIKGGANYSLINTETDGISTSGNPSYLGGAFARLKVKRLTAQAEVLFTGVSGEIKDDQSSQTVDVRYSNVDVPVLLGYRFINRDILSFAMNAGVVQSFNVTQGGDLDANGFEDGYTNAAVGFSLDIPLFLFDVRYQHPLGDFYDNNTARLDAGLISLSVGWKIL